MSDTAIVIICMSLAYLAGAANGYEAGWDRGHESCAKEYSAQVHDLGQTLVRIRSLLTEMRGGDDLRPPCVYGDRVRVAGVWFRCDGAPPLLPGWGPEKKDKQWESGDL